MDVVDMLGTIDAATDKGPPGAIEHQKADTGAIGAIF
jgi:hypothetical protein